MLRSMPVPSPSSAAGAASESNRSPGAALVLERVGKSYFEGDARRTILEAIDLEIAPAERVALLGRSGSGKSTLLNLAGGIDRPDAGRILVGGEDLGALDEAGVTRFRRRSVGLVFQAFHLVPVLTVAENVSLPLEFDGRLDRAGRARVHELLDRVGLADRAAEHPDHLSGGEQQRVALARALVRRPTLLLADEPTGNLDEETAESVLALLDTLAREEGTAVLMATHSIRSAAHCDRALRLDHGHLRVETLQPQNAP